MSDERHPEVIAKEAIGLLRELASADLTGLSEGEVLELALLATDAAKLATAAQVVAAGRIDVSRAWVAEGARSASAWLAWRGHLPTSTSGAVLRCARQLRALPAAERALLEGRITLDHVRLLAAAQRTDPDAYAEDEQRLVELAGELLFSRFEVVIRYWRQHQDPDGAEDDAADRRASRRLHCSATFDGMVVLDALLDPLTGAIMARELERLERALFETDWAEARERLGEAATVADLARTPAQRRADALRVMAERSAAKPAGATEPRVLLQVLAGTHAVERMCELSDGTVVTPGEVLPTLRWADVERVVFDGPSKVIDIGVRQRLFTGATRTAVETRDLFCQHPSCDVPAERCEIDHIQPYEASGPTTQANGRCYCPFHHRWRHRRPPPAA